MRIRETEALRLLHNAYDLFTDCTNYQETLNRVAKLLVSSLATWCTVDLVGDNRKIERVAAAHSQPSRAHLVKKILTQYPPCPKATRGIYRVIETGQSILIPHIPESQWALRAESPEHLRLIMDLGSSSYMCIPLQIQNQVIGAMMLLSDDRTYDQVDVQTAEFLATRLAMAIENTKKFEQLQKSLKARDEFLAIAAHEIRNPLSLIALHLERLDEMISRNSLEETDFQKIRQSLSGFQRQMGRLAPLFDKILDRSALDSEKMRLELTSVNLPDLVKNLISRFHLQMQAMGIRATLKENTSVHPAIGFWDQDRLEQVVANLISNAIKYGNGNDIDIEISSTPDHVNLFVHDQGIGIPGKEQRNLFEPFQRLEMNSAVRGTGLGMYISKRIVEAHDGQISVHSIWGQGSTFRICLPLKPSQGVLANFELIPP